MAKKPTGRPAWEPTDEDREQIRRAAAIGYTQGQISQLMGKDEDTLRKHCKAEMEDGKVIIDAMVGGKLMDKIIAGDTTSIIFYLKTRMGWKETTDVNLNATVTFTVERTHRKGDNS